MMVCFVDGEGVDGWMVDAWWMVGRRDRVDCYYTYYSTVRVFLQVDFVVIRVG